MTVLGGSVQRWGEEIQSQTPHAISSKPSCIKTNPEGSRATAGERASSETTANIGTTARVPNTDGNLEESAFHNRLSQGVRSPMT